MSLQSTIEIMKDIMVVYAARGKKVVERLDFKSGMGEKTGRILKLDQMLKM